MITSAPKGAFVVVIPECNQNVDYFVVFFSFFHHLVGVSFGNFELDFLELAEVEFFQTSFIVIYTKLRSFGVTFSCPSHILNSAKNSKDFCRKLKCDNFWPISILLNIEIHTELFTLIYSIMLLYIILKGFLCSQT